MNGPHPRRATAVGCGLAVVAILVLGACDHGGATGAPRAVMGRLTFPSPLNPGLIDALGVEPDSDWLLGSIPVCSSNGAPVTVEGVRGRDGDLEVTSFSVRDNPARSGGVLLGEARGDLATQGLRPTPDITITRPCDKDGGFFELIIEIRAADHDTSTTGFTVAVSSGNRRSTLDVPYETHSCVDHTTAVCQGVPAWPMA